jgi:hypothetical protein
LSAKVEKSHLANAAEEPILWETFDWQDFLDLSTLPRKAGCSPQDLPGVVYNEGAANACDAGRKVRIGDWTDPKGNCGAFFQDDGPGLEPEEVAAIYSLNRPRLSSKQIRRLSCGMLGNGARIIGGTVAASEGTLMVESRGHRLWLEMDRATGKAFIGRDEPIPFEPGVKLHIALGQTLALKRGDLDLALATIRLSGHGRGYSGPSSPWWYGPQDFYRLTQEAQIGSMSFTAFARKLGFTVSGITQPAWKRSAKELSRPEVTKALKALQTRNKAIPPGRLGLIGKEAFPDTAYAKETGVVYLDAAELPFVLEAWVKRESPAEKANGELSVELLVNREVTPVRFHGAVTPQQLTIHGCDLHHATSGPQKIGNYRLTLSVLTPYLPLTTDGKEPALRHLLFPILSLISRTARKAHEARERPEVTRIKEAAWEIMPEAYRDASDNGELPAKARQIMYAARPYILERTGLDRFGDKYFTQTLLPDYLEEHPQETASWDVVFDARGNATEPHTQYKIPLGTLPVRQYLKETRSGVSLPKIVDLPPFPLFPTRGPLHRYKYALFIEKEGFDPLLDAGQIAEKYDLLITSTKGLTVTALRQLLDELHEHGLAKVFVLHDFDISGFSILGTLGKSNRRYRFSNPIEIVDLGLRLADVQTEELQSEPIALDKDALKQQRKWAAQALTLQRHGASPEEIEFLRKERSELNMLTGRRFLAFLEGKLAAHGVEKYIPDEETLRLHRRRFYEYQLAKKLLDEHRSALQEKAASLPLPQDLLSTVKALLEQHPEWPWDQAVTDIPLPAPARRGVITPLD